MYNAAPSPQNGEICSIGVGVGLEVPQRGELQRRRSRGGEDYGGRHSRLERLLPTGGDHAPAIARLEAGKHPLRLGSHEIVSAGNGKLEKLIGHHRADDMDAEITRPGPTGAVAVVAGQGFERA